MTIGAYLRIGRPVAGHVGQGWARIDRTEPRQTTAESGPDLLSDENDVRRTE
jgi:hypothetical protein